MQFFTDLKAYKVGFRCPVCKEGEMKYDMRLNPRNNKLKNHNCTNDNCNHSETFYNEQYPRIEYKEVG